MPRLLLENPAYYINRELSWLAFNRRVLEEADDTRNPLLERVKFLAISASNLDEFFEVRIAGLLQMIEEGDTDAGNSGMTPEQTRDALVRQTHGFMQDQYRCWNERLKPALAGQGIRILALDDLSPEQRSFAADYSERELDPLLTPVTVDPAHPFPRVINKALCMAFLLHRRRRAATTYFGVMTVPRVLPRIVALPSSQGSTDFIFLADLVAAHAERIYRGYEIISSAAFRVTRNSNLYLEEEEARSLLESVRTEIHNRRKGDAVRLEIEADAAPGIVDTLRTNFGLENWQVYATESPVNLSRVMNIYTRTDRPDLKYRSFSPRSLQLTAKSRNLFDEIRRKDILLHHPFDSYDAVVSFIEAAVSDPAVLSIKQTLYRTNEESPIVEALIEAAAAKQVTAVVEVKARFDEAPNIRWARNMEDAGVQVFHGLVGLKTHCKLTLIARRDADGTIRHYAHLGTGNYNPVTARIYTDLSLLTAEEDITGAVHEIFNFLTAYSEVPSYEPLWVAPINLAERSLELIAREAEHARARRPARIVAKMNALTDKNVIQALYRASQAGVEIELIVRGMCSLRPGVRGVSDRIRVRSIVGRFLEHSRIFWFANGGDDEIFLGSADWMPRNLYERAEVMFPVREPMLRERIKSEILAAYLADTCKTRILRRDGVYERIPRRRGTPEFDAQEFLIGVAEGHQVADIPHPAARRRVLSRSR